MTRRAPSLPGVLTAHDLAATAAAIAAVQERDGAIPFAAGQHADVWNHVEAAMALLVGGEGHAAHRAYDWCLGTQRADGSWPMRFVDGVVADHAAETNMSAYLAVGVWHHWLVRRDERFVRRTWPAVRAGLDYVVARQLPFGGIAWAEPRPAEPDAAAYPRPTREPAGALLAGSASIFHALTAGLALSGLMDAPQPDWELAACRLRHALRRHRDLFLDKSTYSMDWYYPVLGGAVRGQEARDLLAGRWEDFVVPGLGIRCVDTNPWVTGAETCELVLSLDALGDRDRALTLLRDMQHLRSERGGYWTGYVWPDDALWPPEETTYTAAAVVLAVDALSGTTPGSDLFRGSSLSFDLPEIGLECGCTDVTVRQRVG